MTTDDDQPVQKPAPEPAPGPAQGPAQKRRVNPLVYFWVYSLLRIALLAVLFGLLWLFGLGGLIGAAVAVVLSVPLSFVLLARPRNAMTAAMMERLNVRQERTARLDEKLSGVDDEPDTA
jgi:hypothetical protein